ncbi:L-serine dehydratase, iron-sulfur-dependent subunit beta [Streptococcus pneumoniae]|nr:L-serine dehydratase, iron-sulfur-dependent subunit beta [Streptococcus pneumoniae]
MKSLRFQSVFDIIGPVMIGPSSSHTAGAGSYWEDCLFHF